jgi:hypothetical protein
MPGLNTLLTQGYVKRFIQLFGLIQGGIVVTRIVAARCHGEKGSGTAVWIYAVILLELNRL